MWNWGRAFFFHQHSAPSNLSVRALSSVLKIQRRGMHSPSTERATARTADTHYHFDEYATAIEKKRMAFGFGFDADTWHCFWNEEWWMSGRILTLHTIVTWQRKFSFNIFICANFVPIGTDTSTSHSLWCRRSRHSPPSHGAKRGSERSPFHRFSCRHIGWWLLCEHKLWKIDRIFCYLVELVSDIRFHCLLLLFYVALASLFKRVSHAFTGWRALFSTNVPVYVPSFRAGWIWENWRLLSGSLSFEMTLCCAVHDKMGTGFSVLVPWRIVNCDARARQHSIASYSHIISQSDTTFSRPGKTSMFEMVFFVSFERRRHQFNSIDRRDEGEHIRGYMSRTCHCYVRMVHTKDFIWTASTQ